MVKVSEKNQCWKKIVLVAADTTLREFSALGRAVLDHFPTVYLRFAKNGKIYVHVFEV